MATVVTVWRQVYHYLVVATVPTDIDGMFAKLSALYEKTKNIEMQFLKNNGINIVLEEDAIDYIIKPFILEDNATITIPMRSGVESLSVVASAAVILFEAARQRRGISPTPDGP